LAFDPAVDDAARFTGGTRSAMGEKCAASAVSEDEKGSANASAKPCGDKIKFKGADATGMGSRFALVSAGYAICASPLWCAAS